MFSFLNLGLIFVSIRIEGQSLPFNGFAHRDQRDTGKGESDICTMYRLRTKILDITTSKQTSSSGEPQYALAIELVGNRFLRRMVRLLVATSVRESILPEEVRNEKILYEICQSGDRQRAALAVSGMGLALCGVGYDLEDLRDYKNQSNSNKPSQPTTDSAAVTSEMSKNSSEQEANPQSRRRKYHQKLLQQKQAQYQTHSQNINQSVAAFYQPQICKVSHDQILPWRHELICYDSMLLHYPERAFEFTAPLSLPNSNHVLLPQNSGHIFSTIWDAEVILAHHLDIHADELIRSITSLTSSVQILELGAGNALAGIVLMKLLTSKCTFLVQEIDEKATEYSLQCIKPNVSQNFHEIVGVSAFWGTDCITAATKLLKETSTVDKVHVILMCDVFYHEEHFEDLLQTIQSLLASEGILMFAFEQRRKDLLPMVQSIVAMFSSCKIFQYSIASNSDVEVAMEGGETGDEFNQNTTRTTDIFVVYCIHKK